MSDAARARLDRYVALLLAGNERANLTAARDAEAVAAHVADALTIAPYVEGALVDVGSGGGLPGIPLAIVLGVPLTLIESVGKKARFLREAVAALELDATVVEARAEEAGRDPALRERFRSATARAVGTLPTVLELTLPLLAVGGAAVLQRGALDERERVAAADAARMLGGEVVVEHVIDGERRVVLVRKVAPTAARFPRRSGVPAKRPLCLGPRAGTPA